MLTFLLEPLFYAYRLLIEDLQEHARVRPIKLLIVVAFVVITFMITYDIYTIDEFVDWIYGTILWLWMNIVRITVQFLVDLMGSIFQFIAMFLVGVMEGIIQMWKGFTVPKVRVPKINIKHI